MARVQDSILAAVTSKRTDSTNAASQFLNTSEALKNSEIMSDTEYPERQQLLRGAIAEGGLAEKSEQAQEAAAQGLFICECKTRELSSWEDLASPLERNCSNPSMHYWWSPEQQAVPRPRHFAPLRVEYREGDWLYLSDRGIMLQQTQQPKQQPKPVTGIRVDPRHSQILISHPDQEAPTKILLNSNEELSPIIELVEQLYAAHVEQLSPGDAPVDLEVPTGLCEGRVFDSSAFWRLWVEPTPTGPALSAAANGFSQSSYEYEYNKYQRTAVDSLSSATAIEFDASCLCLWVEGRNLNDSADDPNCSDSIMLRLGLPRQPAALQRLLKAARSLAMTANVPVTSFPAALDEGSLMDLPTVSLAAVRNADTRAVDILSYGLHRRGFCLVDVDDCLATLGDTAMSEAEAFLSTKIQQESQPSDDEHNTVKEEDELSQLHLVGHFEDQWKGGVRILTKDLIDEPTQQVGLPEALKSALRAVAQELDAAAIDVMRSCMPLFSAEILQNSQWESERNKQQEASEDSDVVAEDKQIDTAEKLCNALGVALLFDSKVAQHPSEQPSNRRGEEESEVENSKFPQYGIVDCVRYRGGEDCPEMLVGAHIDPGLFVLALPQQGQGLQLCDEHGSWLDIPAGKGIIWAGYAAAGRFVKGGQHRVTCTNGQPRVAIWHECCTYGQLVPPVLELLENHELELRMGEVRGTIEVLKQLHAAEDHREASQSPSERWSQKNGRAVLESVPPPPAVGQGTLVIKGVPLPKSGSYGWQQLIGPQALAATSGSWSSSYSREPPPGAVEVVPRRYDLRAPSALGRNLYQSNRTAGDVDDVDSYGSRRYLQPGNLKPRISDGDPYF